MATSLEPTYGDGKVNVEISMAFGNQNSPLLLYMLHQVDNEFPDDFVSRPDMTILGFGRENKEKSYKFLNDVQPFLLALLDQKIMRPCPGLSNGYLDGMLSN